MGRPWGLSGPEFLSLYGGLLLLPALVSYLWLHAQRRRYTDDVPPPLSAYQLAWLAGGPVRAAETVIARLLRSGDLRINSDGFLTKVAETSADPLEKSALTASRNVHRARAIDTIRGTKASVDMGYGLVTKGLLMPPGVTRRRLRATRWMYVAVLVFGIVRWVNGAEQGYPIGYLTIMLVVCVIAIVLISVRLKRSMVRRTVLGDRVLAEQRNAVTVGGSGSTDAAAAVALGGLSAYPEPDIRAALATGPPRDFASSGGSSSGGVPYHTGCGSSGFAGCSSGGGGGGCGGGGGGCGGGGS